MTVGGAEGRDSCEVVVFLVDFFVVDFVLVDLFLVRLVSVVDLNHVVWIVLLVGRVNGVFLLGNVLAGWRIRFVGLGWGRIRGWFQV
jgi:hypothetical protein